MIRWLRQLFCRHDWQVEVPALAHSAFREAILHDSRCIQLDYLPIRCRKCFKFKALEDVASTFRTV
jgi:hypothetical protein